MAIKRVKIENIASLGEISSYTGMSRLWFYDKDGVRYESGAMLLSGATISETDNMYIEAQASINSRYYPWEAVDTNHEISQLYDYSWIRSVTDSNANTFQVVFKKPLETLSKFTIDVQPYSDTSVDSYIKVSFYDENDDFLISYELDVWKQYKEKSRYRIVTVETPELKEGRKYAILQDVQDAGTRNYTIKKREIQVVPRWWKADFDKVVKKITASDSEYWVNPESVYMEISGTTDYSYHNYYESIAKANGVVNVFYEVAFNKPQILHAFEYSGYSINYCKDVKLVIEAFDETSNEWIELGSYDRYCQPQYTMQRYEFENSNYYFRYRVTFVNIGTGNSLLTNRMRWISQENFIQEVSIASGEDYKKHGISTYEKIETNNLKKIVTQTNKLTFFNGNLFSKKFDLTTEKIRSITI